MSPDPQQLLVDVGDVPWRSRRCTLSSARRHVPICGPGGGNAGVTDAEAAPVLSNA